VHHRYLAGRAAEAVDRNRRPRSHPITTLYRLTWQIYDLSLISTSCIPIRLAM